MLKLALKTMALLKAAGTVNVVMRIFYHLALVLPNAAKVEFPTPN